MGLSGRQVRYLWAIGYFKNGGGRGRQKSLPSNERSRSDRISAGLKIANNDAGALFLQNFKGDKSKEVIEVGREYHKIGKQDPSMVDAVREHHVIVARSQRPGYKPPVPVQKAPEPTPKPAPTPAPKAEVDSGKVTITSPQPKSLKIARDDYSNAAENYANDKSPAALKYVQDMRASFEKQSVTHGRAKADAIIQAIGPNPTKDHLLSVLKQARGESTSGGIRSDLSKIQDPVLRSKINESLDLLNTIVPETAHVHGVIEFNHDKFSDRASASGELQEVHISTSQRAKIVSHEIGHVLEFTSPGAQVITHDYLTAITGKGKTETMRQATGNMAYGASEVRYLPKPNSEYLVHDYVTRKYKVTSKSSLAPTEVLSLGLEMLHGSPLRFYTDHPQHFRATIAALHA